MNKKIILVKGKAGLGNRILSLLTALLYAKLSNRTLYVDWRDEGYSKNGENSFSHFFEGPNIKHEVSTINPASISPIIWKDNLALSAHDLVSEKDFNKLAVKYLPWFYRQYSVDLSRINYEENVLVFAAYTQKINKLRRHFTGKFSYLAEKSTFEILSTLLKDELTLKTEIKKKVDDFKDNFFHSPVIGVHVRYTDRKAPLEKYHKELSCILEKNKDSQIFLATDNNKVQEEFRTKYNNVITTNKWLPEQGERIHYNTKSDPISTGVEALIDMHLLAKCDHMVFAGRSTFSMISLLLSQLKNSNTHDIDQFNIKVKLRNFVDIFA